MEAAPLAARRGCWIWPVEELGRAARHPLPGCRAMGERGMGGAGEGREDAAVGREREEEKL